MAAEYEIVESCYNRHYQVQWCRVRHKVDGHMGIYCLRCRKVSPYEGELEWADQCPACGTPFAAKAPPDPTPAPPRRYGSEGFGSGDEPINPTTGRGEYSGDKYEMVYDWDRGYVWVPFVGMK